MKRVAPQRHAFQPCRIPAALAQPLAMTSTPGTANVLVQGPLRAKHNVAAPALNRLATGQSERELPQKRSPADPPDPVQDPGLGFGPGIPVSGEDMNLMTAPAELIEEAGVVSLGAASETDEAMLDEGNSHSG